MPTLPWQASLKLLLLISFTSLADDSASQLPGCTEQVALATEAAQFWWPQGYPFNLAAAKQGLLPDSSSYQLMALAYQLLAQRQTEPRIRQLLQQRCQQFSHSDLSQPQSFFASSGQTAANLLVCAELTSALVASFRQLDSQPITLPGLMRVFAGEEPKPAIAELAQQAVALAQQRQPATLILEQVFAYCDDQPLAFKHQLTAEYGH
ncbi:hypothetical protein [Arsukibacterium sp.]|uniref:hypothetical protein n=1 Tax=Arsukibacterium sp. TaxID=1977258 RepID=UPI002FDB96D1